MYPRQIPVMWMHRPLQSKKERPFLQRKKQQRERKVPQRQQAHRLRKRQERYPDERSDRCYGAGIRVKFQFDEEDTSTDDATGEFSQVYTYIIYK